METERGFVAIGLLLAMLLAVGSTALRTTPFRASQEAAVTALALADGHDALLGFALTAPNRSAASNRSAGPGLLPCPDTRLDANDVAGQADPPCALSSGTDTGVLPWRTLAVAELRDGAAAPLWYAVANAYRNNPAGVVNSDTAAGLRLDDCTVSGRGLVALLLAPGAALSGQNRNTAEKTARYLASNYLELGNASRGDGCFGSVVTEQANDSVLGLRPEALNQLVAQRVLGEVATALRRYQSDPAGRGIAACLGDAARCSRAWPWVAPWQNPPAADFIGQAGTRRGLLPLRRVGVPFPAPFMAAWSLASGTFSATGAVPPAEDCLRNAETCAVRTGSGEPDVLLPGLAVIADGRCVWNGGTRMRCSATQVARTASGAAFERRWQIEFEDLPRTLQPPDANHPRRERASFAGTLTGKASIRIAAADFLDGVAQGEAALALSAGAVVAQFDINEIPFDLEVDDDGVIDPPTRRSPGELPAWLVANRWHQSLLLAVAECSSPGAPAEGCRDATRCLLVQTERGAAQTASATLVLAGAALPGQMRTRGQASDWFERENALAGEALREAAPTPSFNDFIWRLDGDD